jgi:hypothetical protein
MKIDEMKKKKNLKPKKTNKKKIIIDSFSLFFYQNNIDFTF